MTNERPLPKPGIYAATWLCAVFSAITAIAMLAVYATTGGPNPSLLLVFLFNLPLAFIAAAYPVKLANNESKFLRIGCRTRSGAGREVMRNRSCESFGLAALLCWSPAAVLVHPAVTSVTACWGVRP